MYDVFSPTPDNAAPYDTIGPTYPLLERNTNTAANRDISRGYDWAARDAVPQDVFDRVLWRAIHGASSQPPPPGPNAVAGQ
jgi:hypothetical protein